MMKKWGWVGFVAAGVVVGMVSGTGCSLPHRVVGQDDITAREWNDPSLERRVLIASRSSEFKDEVVERVEGALRQEAGVYVKVVGVDNLAGEDASRYRAVVLVNTCMAWKMDPKIEAFLEKQPRTDRIIVLTTSNTGEWKPGDDEMAYDAVTSASEAYDPGAVADGIVDRVKRLLEQEPAE